MIRAIARQFGDALDVFGGQAGLHLVLGLPDYVDDTIVVQEAFVRGVIVRPLSKYYLNQKDRKQGLLIGYASIPVEQIDPAFDVLAKSLQARKSVVEGKRVTVRVDLCGGLI